MVFRMELFFFVQKLSITINLFRSDDQRFFFHQSFFSISNTHFQWKFLPIGKSICLLSIFLLQNAQKKNYTENKSEFINP